MARSKPFFHTGKYLPNGVVGRGIYLPYIAAFNAPAGGEGHRPADNRGYPVAIGIKYNGCASITGGFRSHLSAKRVAAAEEDAVAGGEAGAVYIGEGLPGGDW